jgi:hypothetical protein
MGFAFGKAIAFTYAVIVSVVANLVFDFVREPPHGALPKPVEVARVTSTDGAAARAALPASPPAIVRVGAPPIAAPPQTPPVSALPVTPTPDSARPGPGSGGLY